MFTHINNNGQLNMVDISEKQSNKRTAKASCLVKLGKEAFEAVKQNQVQKGDVLSVSKIAGIQSAKQTHHLIPLCHSIALDKVNIEHIFLDDDYSIQVIGEVVVTDKTGCEMEALTSVSLAALTIYDMCKAITKGIEITDIKLESKTGGKSGNYNHSREPYGSPTTPPLIK